MALVTFSCIIITCLEKKLAIPSSRYDQVIRLHNRTKPYEMK